MTNPKKRKFPLLSSDHGSEMATVIVGPDDGDQRKFTVHRALLAQHSPYFERCPNGNFREADSVLVLEDYLPESFEFVYRWLYTSKAYPPSDLSDRIPNSKDGVHELQCFWLNLLWLCCHTLIEELQAYAYRQFISSFSTPRSSFDSANAPSSDLVNAVFQTANPVPILKTYLAEVAAFNIMKGKKGLNGTSTVNTWKPSWKDNEEYALMVLDSIAELTDQGAWNKAISPWERPEFFSSKVFGGPSCPKRRPTSK
jgi:hypothetical protein